MDTKSAEAPAVFSLLIFLGVNYLLGYGIGQLLTGSTLASAALALLTPCLSLLGIALFGKRTAATVVLDDTKLEEA